MNCLQVYNVANTQSYVFRTTAAPRVAPVPPPNAAPIPPPIAAPTAAPIEKKKLVSSPS